MSTPKEMNKEQEGSIILDIKAIKEAIATEKQYNKDGIFVKQWIEEGETTSNSYLAKVEKNNSKFVGAFDLRFNREGYGLNTFENGDQYFGYFSRDKRDKSGMYFWKPHEKDGRMSLEYFHGIWNNNKRENRGMYVWLNEPIGNEEFDNANFDVYIGSLKNEIYDRGAYLTKNGDNYYLYYGNLDKNGNKNDDDAFFYSASNDRLIRGKIKDDHFVNGYVFYFDSDSGNLTDLLYVTLNSKGECDSIKLRKDIDEEVKNTMEKVGFLFRNVILEKDYFGAIYDSFKENRHFINENMEDISIFEDKLKFPKIISLCLGFNEFNICNDIEKKALGL